MAVLEREMVEFIVGASSLPKVSKLSKSDKNFLSYQSRELLARDISLLHSPRALDRAPPQVFFKDLTSGLTFFHFPLSS